MRRSAIAPVALLLCAQRAEAADGIRFDIPAQPLRDAILAIAGRAGVVVGMNDPALGTLISRAVHGRMSAAAALDRALAGTAARVVRIDAQTFQIVRRADHVPLPSPKALAVPSHPMASGDIVVTGSKHAVSLDDYAGSVVEVGGGTFPPDRLIHGSDALVEALPVMASTHLGPGRDKLFIRGVADSSFNGPTQATVGQYLGDVRLNYNAPDPDLALYDIDSIEVLEGPQGTLYGAGSLGGVVRLQPAQPDLAATSFSVAAGLALTGHGESGWDGAMIGNIPLVRDRLGLRATIYGGRDGGYIDNPLSGRQDVNGTWTRGGRATLRFRPSPDWTIDLGGVVQNIDSADGQYSERGLPPLQHATRIAQPFDNDYALASLVVRHAMGAVNLVSATSYVVHNVGSTYDAGLSEDGLPTRYQDRQAIRLATNETRLSRHSVDGEGWVLGVELLRSADRLTRTLGTLGAESSISGTSNVVEQASLFGEATLRLAPRWFVTGGARIGYTRVVGDVIDRPEAGDDDQHRKETAVLPSAAILWKIDSGLVAYARYEESVRPGGLSVETTGTQRFEGDSLAAWETGLRVGRRDSPLNGSMALSYVHWEDIQADLVDANGLPYTANIGSGRILGLELRGRWKPLEALSIEGGLFVDDSRLCKPAAGFTGEKNASLPNIAVLTARLAARYTLVVGGRHVELSGSVHYVGQSRLGVGTVLDIHQGRYFDTAMGLSVPLGRVTLSLDATNLFDARSNIFALGNPFGVATGNQMTPLRPRTIRFGTVFAF